jgi:hypothetical protein
LSLPSFSAREHVGHFDILSRSDGLAFSIRRSLAVTILATVSVFQVDVGAVALMQSKSFLQLLWILRTVFRKPLGMNDLIPRLMSASSV